MTGQSLFAGIGKLPHSPIPISPPAPPELDNNNTVNGLFPLLADAASVAAFLCPLLVATIVSAKYKRDWSVYLELKSDFFKGGKSFEFKERGIDHKVLSNGEIDIDSNGFCHKFILDSLKISNIVEIAHLSESDKNACCYLPNNNTLDKIRGVKCRR